VLIPELRKPFTDASQAVLGHARGDEVPLLPYRFYKSLRAEFQAAAHEQLVTLGFANLIGWMAYTIYDDFLDEEGEPLLLPVANVCLRELTLLFQNIVPQGNEFHAYVTAVMDRIDGANAWELTHRRLKKGEHGFSVPEVFAEDPGNTKLAERSLGHALGPLAVLSMGGCNPASSEAKSVERFFSQYIIARQLDDDAHDWVEDLSRGQLNSASVIVLTAWRAADATRTIVRPEDIPELQKLFWDELIVPIAEQMQYHVAEARRALAELTIMSDTTGLLRLLSPIERSAERVLREQRDTLAFLSVFSGAPPSG
jgi:hypothetical protein